MKISEDSGKPSLLDARDVGWGAWIMLAEVEAVRKLDVHSNPVSPSIERQTP